MCPPQPLPSLLFLALFPTNGYQRPLCPEKVEGSPIYPLRVNHELVKERRQEKGGWGGVSECNISPAGGDNFSSLCAAHDVNADI